MEIKKLKIMKFDKIDSYDKNLNKVGEMYLEEFKKSEFYFKSSGVLILDKNNNVILQKPSKKMWKHGQLAMSSAGIVKKGSDFLETAQAETEEELGIKIKTQDLKEGFLWMEKKLHEPNPPKPESKKQYLNIAKKFYFAKVNRDLSKYQIKNSEIDGILPIPLQEFKTKLSDKYLKFEEWISKQKEKILENLEKIKDTEPAEIEFSTEDKSDDLQQEFICYTTEKPEIIEDTKIIKLKLKDEIWHTPEKSLKEITEQIKDTQIIGKTQARELLNKNVIIPEKNEVVLLHKI